MLIRGLQVSPVVLQLFFCLLSWLCSPWLVSDSFVTPRTVLCQAPPSMGFPRQEYWSGLPFPSPGDLPDSCITGGCFRAESPGTFQQFIFNTKVSVAQSHPTLCNAVDCSPPGSSVHGILQARILEWVALSFSRESSRPRGPTRVSSLAGRFFTIWASWRAPFLTRLPGFLIIRAYHAPIQLVMYVPLWVKATVLAMVPKNTISHSPAPTTSPTITPPPSPSGLIDLHGVLFKKKKKLYYLIFLFLALLGLHCCTGFALVVASGGYFLAVVCRFLIAGASLAAEHRL